MARQIEETPREGAPLLVGDWVVEPSLNRVTRAGISIQLELRAIDVLLCLVEHAGEVVSKELLLDTVWQTEFVSDNTVAARIAELRSAFGDDAHEPRYIETIRKRGYRLIAEVRPVTAEDEAPSVVPGAIPSPDEERNPYPGLAAFTEADAENFFGREAEVAALWRRITSRRLLAVIGPSGVGKSSLLRAGVAPRAPPGWRVVVFTPGEAPELSLARALAPDHAGDPAAMARLLGFSDTDTVLAVVARWRGLFDEAVLVVDQFEELFTLNPPEVQAGFIGLLRRLVDATDIHLVLAMRDDYLYRCQDFEEIAPIFRELTPLPPPKAEGLRRALKEPAARRLYRFESELLVDRIVAEVEGERGALPLMAFAVHRLWEERDRERRELTEEAYERIGGVAGALARHADATLERIGPERQPIVRELFRNLVTAEGTRAIREVGELLEVFEGNEVRESESEKVRRSVLPSVASKTSGVERRASHSEQRERLPSDSERSERSLSHSSPARDDASEVLRDLIDARLLTGYREQNHDERPVHRVEIVHESLLTSWPRVVRWQTQDADSARLRDELRQAARLWDDHDRGNDYLWTGSAFQEFAVWRESYPGGLTDVEEDFASAMTSHATRSRRRRRIAVAAIIAVLLAVLVVVGTLWRQSVRETMRAEAAKLLALGQLRLEDYPTATLAHAIASLDLADTPEARRLALRALWEGPTAFVVDPNPSVRVHFAPNGDWLVQSIQDQTKSTPAIQIAASKGSASAFDRVNESAQVFTHVNPTGQVLFSEGLAKNVSHVVLRSLPDGRVLNQARIERPVYVIPEVFAWNRDRCLALVHQNSRLTIFAFNFDGTTNLLATLDIDTEPRLWSERPAMAMDLHTGRWLATVENQVVSVFEIGEHDLSDPQVLGRHEGSGHRIALDPDGRFVATSSENGLIKVWDLVEPIRPLEFRCSGNIEAIEFFGREPLLAAYTLENESLVTWLYSFADGFPRLLRRFSFGQAGELTTREPPWGWDLTGRRLARDGPDFLTRVWDLSAPTDAEPLTLRRGAAGWNPHHSFHPEGDWIATADLSNLMVWPMRKKYPFVINAPRGEAIWRLDFGPDGRWLAWVEPGLLHISPLAGRVPASGRTHDLNEALGTVESLAASPDGGQILVGSIAGADVLPLDGPGHFSIGRFSGHYTNVAFSPSGRFAAAAGSSDAGLTLTLRVWRTDSWEETVEIELRDSASRAFPSFVGDTRILVMSGSEITLVDLASGSSTYATDGVFGNGMAASADGRVVAAIEKPESKLYDEQGRAVLVDLESGTRKHLERHGDEVASIAISADGSIVVTGDSEGVLRIGAVSGAEPHLLFGHGGIIHGVDIDPLGRWIATGGQDGTVRIWPMPDLSKPPLHTLPHDELMAKLKSLTNLRVVRDQESETGWTLTHDPFPGWETVPSW